MGIADFFRPKYKHSDVKVRLEAVRALTSDESDILATIARSDKDAGVRRIAIEKLDEVEVLAEIASRDDDRGLRDLAGSRAAEIWVSSACQDEDDELAKSALSGLLKLGDQRALAEVANRAAVRAVRQEALAKLEEPRALADLARSTSSPEVRQQVVARISDADVLRALAVDTTVKELGLLAVDRISARDVLEQVAQKAKNKAVRQRARKKVDDLVEADEAKKPRESDEVRRRRAEKSQLVRELDAINEHFEWEQSLIKVKAAEAAWAKLGDTSDAALDERFAAAVSRYHARRETAEKQAHHHEEALAATSNARRAAAQAFEERARERAAERRRDADDGDVVNEAAMAIMKSQLAEEQAQRAARERENAARRAEREARKAERAEADLARTPKPDPAEVELKREESAERRAQIARSLEALVDEMASLLESNDVKAIDRLLEQARTAFAQAGRSAVEARDQHAARYEEIRGKLVIRAKDLRESEDWKRFANVPKAEQLVALAKELSELEQPRIEVLKELQKTWKEVGPIPGKKSKELWEQFKAHTDAAFVKIKGARELEGAKHAEAAKVKEALIAEAEALADSTDWEATASALKGLQQRWKESGHVPRKQGDELWKRFRAACDRFFERRKPMLDAQHEELEQNKALKEALIARAEAVVAKAPGEDGWGKAIGEIKSLGVQWKEIGRVPRADIEPLWQRFRTACDGLFAKRDAARDAEADARRAELEALREEMETVLAGGDDVAGRALAVRRKVAEMAERDVEPSAELRGLYERMLRVAITEHGEALRGSELDPVAMSGKRTKLIARAEALMPKAAPVVSADAAPADIAAQLKQAMQANALFKGDGRDPYEVIEELRAEWAAVGPVVGDDAEAQAAKFAEVSAAVLERAGGERPPRAERPERGERRDRGPRDDRGARDDRGGERKVRRERRERRRDDAAAATEAAITAPPSPAAAAPAPLVDTGTNKVAVAPPPPPAPSEGEARVEEPAPAPPRAHARAATEVAMPPPVQVDSAAPQVIVEAVERPVIVPSPYPERRRAGRSELATQAVPVVAAPDAVTTKTAIPPPPSEIPRRARTSTLPPGVVEKLDDEWAADDAPAAAAATAPTPPPAPTAADAPAPAATTAEAVDEGWD